MRTSTYTDTIYRIKRLDGRYVYDFTFGYYEFMSKENAQNYIKDHKLDAVVEQENSTTIVETDGADYTKTIRTETRKVI